MTHIHLLVVSFFIDKVGFKETQRSGNPLVEHIIRAKRPEIFVADSATDLKDDKQAGDDFPPQGGLKFPTGLHKFAPLCFWRKCSPVYPAFPDWIVPGAR